MEYLASYYNNDSFSGEPFVTRIDKNVNFEWMWQAPAEGLRSKRITIRWIGFVEAPHDGRYRFSVQCHHGDYRLLIDGKVALEFQKLNNRRFPDTAEVWLRSGEKTGIRLELLRTRDDDAIRLAWEDATIVEEEEARGMAAAREADVVVACFGFSRVTESECDDREYGLAPSVERYIEKLAEANPRLVLVLFSGGSVATPWLAKVKALVHAFFPGQAGGTAIAEILLGEKNPSAKLPFTWEKALADRAEFTSYYDHDEDGRVTLENGLLAGYRHFDANNIEPLFPFGFGLSYSTFEYGNLTLSSTSLRSGSTITAAFDITNSGERAGAEIAQLYISDRSPRLTRPPRELKGFVKVALKPGETRRVEMTIDATSCHFYDPDLIRRQFYKLHGCQPTWNRV